MGERDEVWKHRENLLTLPFYCLVSDKNTIEGQNSCTRGVSS
jgi:hypothetical protein